MTAITVYKCETCGWITEDENSFSKHTAIHLLEEEFEKEFSTPKDEGCSWGNGEYSIQRDNKWLESLKAKIIENYPTKYPAWSYGFFRSLDDSGHWLYKWALRTLNTCPTCYQEWGQQYHTKKCNHQSSNYGVKNEPPH